MNDFKLTDNSGQVKAELQSKVSKALEMMGMQAEKYASESAPKKTGRLRDSITHTIGADGNGKAAYIGTNVEYAIYVEMDDRKRHTNGKAHYLHDAVANHASEYNRIATSALKG